MFHCPGISVPSRSDLSGKFLQTIFQSIMSDLADKRQVSIDEGERKAKELNVMERIYLF